MALFRKRNLFLHIGDPKTGTSSVQRAMQLGLVEGETRKVAGFLTESHSANAIALARAFHKENSKRVKPLMREVRSWLESTDADFAIISSEFFSDANPALVRQAFSSALANSTLRDRPPFWRRPNPVEGMKVMAYARPHAGRVLSGFIERVRNGYTLSDFQTWLPHYFNSEALFYAPRFQRWRAEFGDNFTVRPFLRRELRNGDAVTDFFAAVFGKRAFKVRETVHENQSIALRALAGLLAFNRDLDGKGIPLKRRLPLSRVIHKALSASPGAERPELDRESLARIAGVYREDAQQMDRAFFGKPLFLPALEEAVTTAAAAPIDLTFERYFSAAERAVLMRHCDVIEALLPAEQEAWMAWYMENRKLYNMGQPLDLLGGGEIQRHLQALTVLFS